MDAQGPEHLHSEGTMRDRTASAWRMEGLKGTSEQLSSAYRQVTDKKEPGCVMVAEGQTTDNKSKLEIKGNFSPVGTV